MDSSLESWGVTQVNLCQGFYPQTLSLPTVCFLGDPDMVSLQRGSCSVLATSWCNSNKIWDFHINLFFPKLLWLENSPYHTRIDRQREVPPMLPSVSEARPNPACSSCSLGDAVVMDHFRAKVPGRKAQRM